MIDKYVFKENIIDRTSYQIYKVEKTNLQWVGFTKELLKFDINEFYNIKLEDFYYLRGDEFIVKIDEALKKFILKYLKK